MIDYVAYLHAFGRLVSIVEFKHTEISLYKINGKSIEVWFDIKSQAIRELHFVTNTPINPYLKFLDHINLN